MIHMNLTRMSGMGYCNNFRGSEYEFDPLHQRTGVKTHEYTAWLTQQRMREE
jgi:hypothetical protein